MQPRKDGTTIIQMATSSLQQLSARIGAILRGRQNWPCGICTSVKTKDWRDNAGFYWWSWKCEQILV